MSFEYCRYESRFKPHLAMGQSQHVMVYEVPDSLPPFPQSIRTSASIHPSSMHACIIKPSIYYASCIHNPSCIIHPSIHSCIHVCIIHPSFIHPSCIHVCIIHPSCIHVCMHQGSFLDYDWSDGDLVFANSTCFDDFLMGSLSDMVSS